MAQRIGVERRVAPWLAVWRPYYGSVCSSTLALRRASLPRLGGSQAPSWSLVGVACTATVSSNPPIPPLVCACVRRGRASPFGVRGARGSAGLMSDWYSPSHHTAMWGRLCRASRGIVPRDLLRVVGVRLPLPPRMLACPKSGMSAWSSTWPSNHGPVRPSLARNLRRSADRVKRFPDNDFRPSLDP